MRATSARQHLRQPPSNQSVVYLKHGGDRPANHFIRFCVERVPIVGVILMQKTHHECRRLNYSDISATEKSDGADKKESPPAISRPTRLSSLLQRSDLAKRRKRCPPFPLGRVQSDDSVDFIDAFFIYLFFLIYAEFFDLRIFQIKFIRVNLIIESKLILLCSVQSRSNMSDIQTEDNHL